MKSLFILITAMHGLIHIAGFAKAYRMAKFEQLTKEISRTEGILWLLAGILFLLAALFFLLNNDKWWILGLPALIISQVLIILTWQDARYGTIANIIVLLTVLVAFHTWRFNTMVAGELSEFTQHIEENTGKVDSADLNGLPAIVQKYFYASGIAGRDYSGAAFLKQKGQMRTTPEGNWMSFTAEQWFRYIDPGFIWKVRVNAFPGIFMLGRDNYINGKGGLLIKLLGVVPVAEAEGPKVDQGSLLRYLAEAQWAPWALLHPSVEWTETDSLSATATMTYGEVSASGIFHFTTNGDIESFEAKRYYGTDENSVQEDWYVKVLPDGIKEFDGIRIPASLEVSWRLKEGDFLWLKMEVEEVEYR